MARPSEAGAQVPGRHLQARAPARPRPASGRAHRPSLGWVGSGDALPVCTAPGKARTSREGRRLKTLREPSSAGAWGVSPRWGGPSPSLGRGLPALPTVAAPSLPAQRLPHVLQVCLALPLAGAPPLRSHLACPHRNPQQGLAAGV